MPDLKANISSNGNATADIRPSQALLAAQRLLEQLRAARQRPRRRPIDIYRPPLPDGQPASAQHPDRCHPADVSPPADSCASAGNAKLPPATVRLHPALALAILGAEQAAAGRIWLLLRVLDETGRGWLPTDLVREKMTRKGSTTHVCGRRQLCNLLNQGQDIFWTRQQTGGGRIWLKSPARVAAALDLERLSGRPAEIPLAALLGGIGQVRAHFYASFHGSRQAGDDYGAPISRARLAALTHIPPRTQRLYDEAAGVKRQANYAVGAEYSNENIHERAWQHGRAVFKFVDHQGKQGYAGRRYVAWRLPNSYYADTYGGPASDKRKRNYKRPADLVTTGAQGNDRSLKRCPRQPKTLFHPDGGAAGKAYNGNCSVDAYWPEPGQSSRVWRPVKIWQVIGRSPSRRGGNCLPGL
jgi:hypothetical protein